MQEFIATYGLWLLVSLAIVIALAFLLKSKGNNAKAPQSKAMPPVEALRPEEPLAPPPPVAEPATPVAKPIPTPAAEIAPTLTSTGEPDNLLRLKGVGPKVNGILNSLGITRFEQIAAWTSEDIARIDPQLGNFSGRIVRDQWVDQATYLARGDIAGFEAKYGKL